MSSATTQSQDRDNPGAEDKGTDTGSWEQHSGEGSASALAHLKNRERARSESRPAEEGPSSS
ncbi:MAG: hypothetical protein HYX47_14530 [Burkholderiales bacterium]|nr:hypothetical protein [Burkholderiales bacterium]